MGKTVLIVDDSKLERERLKDALVASGYEVLEAANGTDGFQTAVIRKPDLIVLDLIMPRMGGLGVLNMLQSDLGISYIPVIILTGNEREDEREEALQAGAKLYFSKKGSDLADILSGVESLIGKG